MDKTRIRNDEWCKCHLQRAMIHSHGRCIKAVYAREARGAYVFASHSSNVVSPYVIVMIKIVKRLN